MAGMGMSGDIAQRLLDETVEGDIEVVAQVIKFAFRYEFTLHVAVALATLAHQFIQAVYQPKRIQSAGAQVMYYFVECIMHFGSALIDDPDAGMNRGGAFSNLGNCLGLELYGGKPLADFVILEEERRNLSLEL